MELSNSGFEKSELMKIAERIHECNGKKQQLEISLSSEEFHKKYIHKREDLTARRILANLPIVILFIVGVLLFAITMTFCILAKTEEKIGYAFSLLFEGLFLVVIYKSGWKLFIEEINMLVMFTYKSSPEKAMRFAKKHGITTFQDDKERCEQRIDTLKHQISVTEEELKQLNQRQDELIEEAKKREDVLKKYNVIKDPESNSSFSLKKDDMISGDITELYEYFDKEESFTRYLIKDTKFKLDSVDKEIAMIDSQFEQVKKNAFMFFVVFVAAIIIQGAIPGIVGSIAGGVCLVLGLIAVFAFERYCSGPVLHYLIENDSSLVKEYCFKNNIIPAKHRREDIIVLLKKQEEILNEIKTKKQFLDSI